jgi:hypothetical protein
MVIQNLKSAQQVEIADASTNNHSFFGYFISSISNQKNNAVAHEVDQLQRQAMRINESLSRLGMISPYGMRLDTDFNGIGIRQAEENEHSFFADWLTSGNYSSIASTNTLSQLSFTTQKVQMVRDQAAHIQTQLTMPMPFQQPPFEPFHSMPRAHL